MFNGKAFWVDEDGEIPTPMSSDEKSKFLSLFASLRDSPSEEQFHERQDALKSATRGLTVRPGNCKKPVTFLSYYERNWESCSFRWVWAFRKNLPTKGTNDTQASESTFRAIKYYTKLEFGGKTPTMNQIIICE